MQFTLDRLSARIGELRRLLTPSVQKQLLTEFRLWSKNVGSPLTASKAVFLDRDGVLTRERSDYVKNPDELELLPGIAEPLREIQKLGFKIVVVTNQSVIGRGLATNEMMSKIHEKLRTELEDMGCKIDAIYYCPHRPDEGCTCRKPEPGLT